MKRKIDKRVIYIGVAALLLIVAFWIYQSNSKPEPEYIPIKEEVKQKPSKVVDPDEIEFEDANVKERVLFSLFEDSTDRKVTKEMAESVKELNLTYFDISSLNDLKYLVNLEKLTLGVQCGESLEPLIELKRLKQLSLNNTDALDFSPIARIENLQVLSWENCNREEISVLKNMAQLSELSLSGAIGGIDAGFYANFPKLTELTISGDKFETIKDIETLANLKVLKAEGVGLKNIKNLATLRNLQELQLSNNELVDISVLSNLTRLTKLGLSSNRIKDIRVIGRLRRLETLNLYDNFITDVSPLLSLRRLVDLNVVENVIGDISVLEPLMRINEFQATPQKYRKSNGEYVIRDRIETPKNTKGTAKRLLLDKASCRMSENQYVSYQGKICALGITSNTVEFGLNEKGDPNSKVTITVRTPEADGDENSKIVSRIRASKTGEFKVVGRLINTNEIANPKSFLYNYEIVLDDIEDIEFCE